MGGRETGSSGRYGLMEGRKEGREEGGREECEGEKSGDEGEVWKDDDGDVDKGVKDEEKDNT